MHIYCDSDIWYTVTCLVRLLVASVPHIGNSFLSIIIMVFA